MMMVSAPSCNAMRMRLRAMRVFVASVACVALLVSQEALLAGAAAVGKAAPDFTADAVMPESNVRH